MTNAVFDPERDEMSDSEWLELLARASGDGRLHFTENQLYLSYARNKVVVTRYVARRGVIGLGMVVVGLATWIYALKADWGITLVLGIAVTLSGVGMVGTGVVTRRDPAPRDCVTRWLRRWVEQRGPDRLISAPGLRDSGAEFLVESPACLLVVERETVVDLLLKNGAHRALSAVIVSESGYPPALANAARLALEQSENLKTVLVHDATPFGVAMATRLRKSSVLPLANRKLIDAGLFPADVIWLAELAPAIPAGHVNQVPLDSLSYEALLVGLRGVLQGAISLYTAIDASQEKR